MNGIVSVNSLPKTLEAVLAYHAANALARSTVISADVSVVPVVGMKWNKPRTMSRVLEKPVTAKLNCPGAGVVILAVGVPGTVALTARVVVGAGLGVTSFIAMSVNCAVMVIVPAVVPVITETFVALPKDACVLPVGIVKDAVQVCDEPLTTGRPPEKHTI